MNCIEMKKTEVNLHFGRHLVDTQQHNFELRPDTSCFSEGWLVVKQLLAAFQSKMPA